jgi:hypothetical protein
MEFRDAVEASDTDRMIAVTSFHMNEAGKVDEFFIMIRPFSAVAALAERMGAELEPAGTEAG